MTTQLTGNRPAIARPAPRGLSRLWNRQLPHYPDTGPRTAYLGITVLVTVVLYYELYVQGAVAPQIIREFGFSFSGFVSVLVIGNLVGAFASLAAGLADRWGRANLVVGGILLSGLLIAFGLPNAPDKTTYTVLYALLSLVEGMTLVATPALIVDFSPQVGRAVAMGFWTLGPVLGSLIVTAVATNTLDSHPDWRFQFYVCGAAGLAVWLVAFVGLRELAPRLRDQLMVTRRDRALIEARAAGIDPEQALAGSWRQMLRLDVIGSALAISIFLLMYYYVLVAFIVVYFQTTFGFTEQKANSLANYFWATNAIVLVIAGILSDRIRVRKPFMIVGALISLVGVGLFASAATQPATSYGEFAAYFVIAAAGLGLTYVTWMASFTETVEKHNPAATATGLAVWGWTIRIVVTLAYAALPLAVPATSTLVDKGPRVQAIAAAHPEPVQVLQAVDAKTLAALQADPADAAAQASAVSQLSGLAPADMAQPANTAKVQQAAARLQSVAEIPPADLAYLQANGAEVAQAQRDNAQQWQTWWWICFAAQIVFIPFVFLMAGRWSPRRAREDEREHERLVEQELARIQREPVTV